MTKKDLTKQTIIEMAETSGSVTFKAVKNGLAGAASDTVIRDSFKDLTQEGILLRDNSKKKATFTLADKTPARPEQDPAEAAAEKAATKVDKAKKEKAPTKSDKIRMIFEKVNSASVEEIAQIIGSDYKNARTLTSILANPARTKDPLPVEYDRANKVFNKKA